MILSGEQHTAISEAALAVAYHELNNDALRPVDEVLHETLLAMLYALMAQLPEQQVSRLRQFYPGDLTKLTGALLRQVIDLCQRSVRENERLKSVEHLGS